MVNAKLKKQKTWKILYIVGRPVLKHILFERFITKCIQLFKVIAQDEK